MLPYSCVFCLICIILFTKVCNTNAKSVSVTSAAYSQASTTEAKAKPKVSNYFRHDPYGPNTYAFGYEIKDPGTGNIQFRDERRYVNGSVEGSYGYVRPDGLITVTRFRAGNESGYASQTQTFDAEDELNVQAHWPTQRPTIFTERPTAAGADVVWDAKSHLNVSATQVADEVASKLKQQTGIDVNRINVEKDLLQPAVLDIVNGKVPLKKAAANGSLGFEPVQNFIPQDFPIVPFKLPTDEALDDKTDKVDEKEDEKEQSKGDVKAKEVTTKRYDQAKANNDEKSPQTEEQREQLLSDRAKKVPATTAKTTPQPPTPAPLVSSSGDDSDAGDAWYEKIIADNRKEFLEQLPKLN